MALDPTTVDINSSAASTLISLGHHTCNQYYDLRHYLFAHLTLKAPDHVHHCSA
eukprot:COSAG01_NODE_759_length_13802_cov_16.155221_15_plen_54_part_00